MPPRRWYHGPIGRAGAETLLALCREGSFLVRDCETSPDDYSLSLRDSIHPLVMPPSRDPINHCVMPPSRDFINPCGDATSHGSYQPLHDATSHGFYQPWHDATSHASHQPLQ
ncbi:sh2 domain-containing adapter protein d [Limosa lapponica baueri]|uniref:Sh2 domain-containing adapter protein d n=1 Tax=Limosa lapponica baueri TaxID=1758121 RepID=A0A2I0T2T5_LIMLA|nr:sh2 domain-containing adapter protein d [Limosa lapponica baueri]